MNVWEPINLAWLVIFHGHGPIWPEGGYQSLSPNEALVECMVYLIHEIDKILRKMIPLRISPSQAT